jgi:hypothetical protein
MYLLTKQIYVTNHGETLLRVTAITVIRTASQGRSTRVRSRCSSEKQEVVFPVLSDEVQNTQHQMIAIPWQRL